MTTILLVEPASTTRRMLELALRSQGFQVMTANRNVEAVELLNDAPIDLALLNAETPDSDGIALLCSLRADDRFHGLPIVLLSDQPYEHLRAVTQGADGFLPKRPNSRDLLNLISHFVTAPC